MTQPYTAWKRWRSCDRKTGRWDSKLAASTAALSAWVHGVFLQPYRLPVVQRVPPDVRAWGG